MKNNSLRSLGRAMAFGLPFMLLSACAPKPSADWRMNRLTDVKKVFGAPDTIGTALGEALHFNAHDAVFVDNNPVAGLDEFTLELVFRQQSGAAFEQRFLHLGSLKDRILFESRVKPDNTWYFDAYINCGSNGDLVLIDTALCHPCDQWYGLALVVKEGKAVSYVNGQPQVCGELNFSPIPEGIASIGVRQNLLCWFLGDIYRLRVTPKALEPNYFLRDYERLNQQ